jgi:hypothetical protein
MGILTFQAAAGGALNLNGPNIAGTVNLTLPSADGTSGQPLQTNGSGTLSFANLAIANGGTGATSFTANQIHYGSFSQSAGLTYDGTNLATTGSFNSINTFGFKNRIINGQMQIAQRGTSGTSGSAVPTTAPTYPSIDRWYAYATGATVTVAQVAGSGAIKNNLQVTGAASVTAVGIGQRIEQLNSYDLAGSTATLSVNISNSLLTTVTWTASYATSADTWSAKTQIATGTFTVTSTLTNYNAQITVPSAATTGIEILLTVGAQTSGTWVIGNVQLEKGSTATSFDYRPYGTELALCQRYFVQINGTAANPAIGTAAQPSTTLVSGFINTPVSMRATPASGGVLNSTDLYSYNTVVTITSIVYTSIGATINGTTSAVGAAGRATLFNVNGAGSAFTLSAEL